MKLNIKDMTILPQRDTAYHLETISAGQSQGCDFRHSLSGSHRKTFRPSDRLRWSKPQIRTVFSQEDPVNVRRLWLEFRAKIIWGKQSQWKHGPEPRDYFYPTICQLCSPSGVLSPFHLSRGIGIGIGVILFNNCNCPHAVWSHKRQHKIERRINRY